MRLPHSIVAKYETRCHKCGGMIRPLVDIICNVLGRWVHFGCVEVDGVMTGIRITFK